MVSVEKSKVLNDLGNCLERQQKRVDGLVQADVSTAETYPDQVALSLMNLSQPALTVRNNLIGHDSYDGSLMQNQQNLKTRNKEVFVLVLILQMKK
jgi:hypothetical protein